MCPPTYFDVREAKNPHMGMAIDRSLAQKQWENLRRSLQDAGLKVEIIDAVAGLDDMVFSANQVFVGRHDEIGGFIVPSRMRYSSRNKEVEFYVAWFRRRSYQVIELDLAGEYLEGHGDLLWHPDRSRIWAGYGFRSTPGGVVRFASAMHELGFPVVELELIDPYCYHLDTCFCPLNLEAALVYPPAFSPGALQAIRNVFLRVYELSQAESRQFVGNGIVVNSRFITAHATANVLRILEREKLTPVLVDTSEFEKSGGSVFCMKTFLE